MQWYYVDGPHRVGPLSETEWDALIQSGKIQPDTLVWHEGMAGWTAFAKIPPPMPATEPEAEEDHSEHGEEDVGETPELYAQRMATRDYPVNIGQCLGRAWALLRAHFWMLSGSTLFIIAIVLVFLRIPGLDFLMGFALQGVFFGGLIHVYLRLMRGDPATVSDLWIGFHPRVFRDLAMKTLISSLASQICFLPAAFAMPKTPLTVDQVLADPQRALSFVLAFGVGLIVAMLLAFCWMFALPLIVDKGLPFWTAMRLSRQKVLQHPWKVGLLTVASGLASMAGLIFTLPISFAASLYLYEDMFAEPAPASGETPPDSQPEPE